MPPREEASESLLADVRRENSSYISDNDTESTTRVQSYLHLVKGYIGPGCLSLPWAVSQLGIPFGVVACIIMSYWSSYNSWTVVRIKRFCNENDTVALTYPDVARELCGEGLALFTSACICVQQLSICTVFLSFCGANLQALALVAEVDLSHAEGITFVLPFAAALCCLPSLKSLAPVMATGTALLFSGLSLLGVVIVMEWRNRPLERIEVDWVKVPLTLCAILYSFEGICLILPVEAVMRRPNYFGSVFAGAMVTAASVFCMTASLSVLAFGKVTNGSITAFLLANDASDSFVVHVLLLIANAVVSLSVLVTYPLQLYPCLGLIEPFLGSTAAQTEAMGFSALRDEPVNDSSVGARLVEEDCDQNSTYQQRQFPDGEPQRAAGSTSTLKTRMTLVFATYVVAIVIPSVESLISLAGALAGSSTAFILPPVLHIAYLRQQEMVLVGTRWRMYVSYALLVFGVIFMTVGTGASLWEIRQTFLH